MEQASPPPVPPAGAQPAADPDSAPATRGDLRALRRWIAVAGVWAVAATAVAIIALLDNDNSSSKDRTADLAAQVSRLQRGLDKRIDDLKDQVEALPRNEDVSKLERRIAKVEDQSSSTAADAKKASDKVSDLDNRVKTLERSNTGGTTTSPGATPP
jgi:septal ring factor EnvC (AmiA/AmiB activator)